jgi:hypothetical protein
MHSVQKYINLSSPRAQDPAVSTSKRNAETYEGTKGRLTDLAGKKKREDREK